MQAVRTIHKVKNGSITIQLPPDFASDEVEVIVLPLLPVENREYHAPQLPSGYQQAIHNFFAVDITKLTKEQSVAYGRARALLQAGQTTDQMRTIDIFAGLIQSTEDLNAENELIELFYGSETDEYGISLP